MKQINPFQKNEELELEITGVTGEGHGVGRCRDVAVFVPFAIPGETVKAHIIKVEKRYCIAKIISILKDSEHRTEPICEAYEKCGGCALMHMDYSEQLRVKLQVVKDALERLGGFSSIEVQPVLGMEKPIRYRNKGSFPFGIINGAVAFGFYAERSHRLIPLFDCPIEDARITAIARTVAEWANRNHISVYDETTRKGTLRACVVRITSTGERMGVIVTKGELPAKESLLRMLDLESLYHNRNDRDTNVIFGDRFTLLKGREQLIERQGDLAFYVSPQSFLQVNPLQTGVLYSEAIRFLDPKESETIADVYCGIGTITLAASKLSGNMIGIECVPEAIEDAKKNAVLNGIKNVEFICGLAEDVLPKLIESGKHIDAIVIDPPRKGCEERVLDAIVDSGINRLVYVSCNPATLARDAKYLHAQGFTIERVQPVDMFPHTQHVETVVLFRREHNIHAMKLHPEPFEMILNGQKTIELRLLDEKRQKIKPGDEIVFTNTTDGRTLRTIVANIHRFDSFDTLYHALPLLQCGYTEESVKAASPADMNAYYSVAEQKKYGVVGIEIFRTDQKDDDASVWMSRADVDVFQAES